MMPERKNYKLYKAKKQWITACATILLGLGATAMTNVSANANPNSESNGGEETEEVVTTQTQHNSEPQSSFPASSSEKATSTPTSSVSSQAQASAISPTSTTDSNKEPASEQTQGSITPHTDTTSVSQVSSDNERPETATLKLDTAQKADAANLAESKVTQNLTPDLISTENPMGLVVAGTKLTDDNAYKFFSNGEALLKVGATFSWVGGAPTISQEQAEFQEPIQGTIKVTFKDGNTHDYDVAFTGQPRAELQPDRIYYVPEQNAQVTDEDVESELYSPEDQTGILGDSALLDPDNVSVK